MTEETLISRNQRKLFFTVAASTLLIGLQSFAVAEEIQTQKQSDAQKQQYERWKIMQDTQTKTQKSQAPKLGGSTGPTVPPKPTQGNAHK